MQIFITRVLAGFVIGIAAVAPGVSGGVIAVGLGLYEPLVHALRYIFRDFKGALRFIAPLAIGGIPGVIFSCGALGGLMHTYLHPMIYLFAGLVAGGLPMVYREATRGGYRALHMAALFIGLIALWIFSALGIGQPIYGRMSLFQSALCGIVEAFGTAIPGISASFMLMHLGLYQSQLDAIAMGYMPELLVMGIAFILTIFVFIRAVSWAFDKARAYAYWAVMGFTIGSVLLVLPPITQVSSPWACVAMLMGGAVCSWLAGTLVAVKSPSISDSTCAT